MSSTAKAKLAPVPDPESEPTVTVAVEGGTVTLTTALSGEDFLTLYRLMDVDATNAVAMYGPVMEMIDRHTVSHTLDGLPILRRRMRVLLAVWKAWNDALQERAVDPTPASG